MTSFLKFHTLVMVAVFLSASASLAALVDQAPSPFLYKDTVQLMDFVQQAADHLAKQGESAFAEFSKPGSEWRTNDRYLFAYDAKGVCVLHPVEPGFVGKDLSALRDFRGQPVISRMLALLENPAPRDAGWFFYVWEDAHHSSPAWKGSYVRKVVCPNGKSYVLGSGLYRLKIEKAFVENTVAEAAEILSIKGKDALFAELRNPFSHLHILDTPLSVVAGNGEILIDPAFPNLTRDRNLQDYRDNAGRNFFTTLTTALGTRDRAWSIRILPHGNNPRLTRHLVFARRVESGGDSFYIIASYVPAMPVWMK
jgi:cytochrome c